MSILLTVLITLAIISVVNTFLIFLVDSSILEENHALIITGGIFAWIILLIGILIDKIKRRK